MKIMPMASKHKKLQVDREAPNYFLLLPGTPQRRDTWKLESDRRLRECMHV